jgi:hypothetical protein
MMGFGELVVASAKGRSRCLKPSLQCAVLLTSCLIATASQAQAPVGPLKFPGFVPCSGLPVVLQDFSNRDTAQNGPAGALPYLNLTSPACITEIDDYHWNAGAGANPGSFRIITQGNKPRTMLSVKALGPSPNVNWIGIVAPMKLLPAGMYYIDDSDHSTWSLNSESVYHFFTTVYGMCAPPATGSSCVVNKFTAATLNAPSGSSTGPVACNPSTSEPIILDRPVCSGPVGTTLSFTVKALPPVPVVAIQFASGPISSTHFVSAGVTKPVPSSTPPFTVTLPPGALVPGNTFMISAPIALCNPGKGNWAWDVWLFGADGHKHGDIDMFIMRGC